MNAIERVMSVINHKPPDRIPCFAANSTVTYDQMEKVNAFWPEGHEKGETMARQAMAAHTVLGFDAVRVPFCQTMEAEALGCTLKSGGSEGIPGIDHPSPYALDDNPVFPVDFLSRGRIPELLKAVRILKDELAGEVPVIAGIIGPFTIAAALLGMVPLLKASYKTPEKMIPFLEVGEKAGTILANALVQAGADIICCEDMTASPDMMAPKTYKAYELEYQRRQFEAISVPKILHICGKLDAIAELVGQTGADILSIEPKTDLKNMRLKCGPDMLLMGGVDTATTLFSGDAAAVRQACKVSIEGGVQILAPGCSISPGTPFENLLAIVDVAKAQGNKGV